MKTTPGIFEQKRTALALLVLVLAIDAVLAWFALR